MCSFCSIIWEEMDFSPISENCCMWWTRYLGGAWIWVTVIKRTGSGWSCCTEPCQFQQTAEITANVANPGASTLIVRNNLLVVELRACGHLTRFPLMPQHHCVHLQWCSKTFTWCMEWHGMLVFSDESLL